MANHIYGFTIFTLSHLCRGTMVYHIPRHVLYDSILISV